MSHHPWSTGRAVGVISMISTRSARPWSTPSRAAPANRPSAC